MTTNNTDGPAPEPPGEKNTKEGIALLMGDPPRCS